MQRNCKVLDFPVTMFDFVKMSALNECALSNLVRYCVVTAQKRGYAFIM